MAFVGGGGQQQQVYLVEATGSAPGAARMRDANLAQGWESDDHPSCRMQKPAFAVFRVASYRLGAFTPLLSA